MKILVTCPFWLSGLLTSELKYLKCKPYDTFPTGTYVDGDLAILYKINIWSRIANKVLIHMGHGFVDSFDTLFDWVEWLDWGKYITSTLLSISVYSKDSKLFSERSIQSVSHKAILNSLEAKDDGDKSSESKIVDDIFVRIENDEADIFLNSSGKSLHNRWWRKQTGEAPLKENIAAGLVLLSGWRFKEDLVDPFCGSWTLLIEAAMIAKNMAPGLRRSFAFQYFSWYDKKAFDTVIAEAETKVFDKEYRLCWYDIDKHMIAIAQNNAENAWVWDCIKWIQKDFFDLELSENKFIVSNPPYGKRLEFGEDILKKLYSKLLDDCMVTGGGFLSSYPLDSLVRFKQKWKKKSINNNGELCTFWKIK